MTVRLNTQTKIRLNKLAELTHHSKSFLASEAINSYLEAQEWLLNEIIKGISEADAGEFINHEDILAYWEGKKEWR